MTQKSKIEWTDLTWNPATGCTKISPGCKNCYAERMAKRLKAMGQPNYANGFKLTMHSHVLELPLKLKKPQTIFVNSMSDMFHKDISDKFIKSVFDVMIEAKQHTFQLLTKRPDRMKEWSLKIYGKKKLPKHIWLGASIENQDYVKRVFDLQKTPARVRFLSVEPLLGPINFKAYHLRGIHWVIVGGESGPTALPSFENGK